MALWEAPCLVPTYSAWRSRNPINPARSSPQDTNSFGVWTRNSALSAALLCTVLGLLSSPELDCARSAQQLFANYSVISGVFYCLWMMSPITSAFGNWHRLPKACHDLDVRICHESVGSFWNVLLDDASFCICDDWNAGMAKDLRQLQC